MFRRSYIKNIYSMSYNKLLQDITSIEGELGSAIPGFDINQFLLDDKEIVKKLIADENPAMPPADIELMTDGFKNLGTNTDATDEEAQDTASRPGLGLTSQGISQSEDQLTNLSELGDTPFKKNLIDESIKKQVDTQKQYPLTEDSPYYKKARSLKATIKQKIMEFVRKVVELVKEIAFAVVTIGTSISGGVGMLAPFAFNVPGMITMILDIIMLLLSLKSKALDALSIFPFFSVLNVLCSEAALNTISAILSKLYRILKNSILSILLSIEDFIKRAISAIKNSTSSDKEGRRARTIARRLRSMEYLPNNDFVRVDEDDIDEVERILEDWEVVKTGKYIDQTKIEATLGEVKRKVSIDELLKELDNLDNVVVNVKDLTGISGDFEENVNEDIVVFDVELPNGEKIIGLSEEELDGLRSTYNVIFSENTRYTRTDGSNNITIRI